MTQITSHIKDGRVKSNPCVAIATLNQTVGDWSGNRARIVEAARQASDQGAELLLCPELCISGYSLLDRLFRASTLSESFESLMSLIDETRDLPLIICVGLPISHRSLVYNAVAVIGAGRLWGLSCKEHLATGDVEYEERYFAAWPSGVDEIWSAPDGQTYPIGALIFESEDVGQFAFEICEDAFRGRRPGSLATTAGAELILNPSASWFTLGKHQWRREMIQQHSREDICAYLYASLRGADNTRLIFDGAGMISCCGTLLAEADRLRADVDVLVTSAHLDLAEVRRARRETGSWRRQIGADRPTLTRVYIDSLGAPKSTGQSTLFTPDWLSPPAHGVEPSLSWWEQAEVLSGGRPLTSRELPHLELELALCLGLSDYLRKAHINSVALALSGGRDSAMVALLVYRAFRYRDLTISEDALRAQMASRFHCAYLATENSGSATQDAARALATELGATFYDLNIQRALDAHHALISEALDRPLSWDNATDDITLQNVQARLRGSVIWMIANSHKALLLATSNKSEAAVGYTTMDGDTSGGLSPIADVPKSLVSLWLRWALERHGLKSLELINGLEPTAELRPASEAQTDEDDLMPFEILDQLIHGFCQLALSPLELFIRLWPNLKDRYYDQPQQFEAHIVKFIRLFCFSQWKRERFAVSFRVMSYDLDPKGGGRYPVIQAPFTEELDELRAHVNSLGHTQASEGGLQ
jgi:NAD+ synthase (glutamine-hydrolysing)